MEIVEGMDRTTRIHGEGERFLREFPDVERGMFTLDMTLDPGLLLTATVTDPDGNTSEFSNCLIGPMANIPSIVNSFGDAPAVDFGSGACATGDTIERGDEDECTLRAAIMVANRQPGPDTIQFNIPPEAADENGVITIKIIDEPLPPIEDSVLIDGYSQPGTAPETSVLIALIGIQIDGSLAGDNAEGLLILGGSSTVQGLSITSFAGNGIFLLSDGNTVRSNFIGIPGGTKRAPDTCASNGGAGVAIHSSGNIVGGSIAAHTNVISCQSTGVKIRSVGREARQNHILGNYIGTHPRGSGVLGEGEFGVIVHGGGNTVGGTEANRPGEVCSGSCNVISAQPPAGGRMILERNLRGFDRLCASCGSQDPADTEASMLESQPGPESAMIDW